MTRARVVVAGLLLALVPCDAHAQLETFVQATRALAAAATAPEPERGAMLRRAAQTMAPALVEWDRALTDTERRADRELPGATPQRQYQLHIELGVAYSARGRHADALRQFDAAAALNPSSSDLQLLRALTFESTGRLDDAAKAFRTAWTLDATNGIKAYYALNRNALSSASDRERARAVLMDAYSRMAAGQSRPAAAPFFALAAVHDGLTRSPVVGDERLAAPFGLLASGQYSDAVALIDRIRDSSLPAADDSPLAHFLRAQTAEADNRIAEARRGYTAALRGTLAGRSTIEIALGRLALVDGDDAAAITAFREAVRLNPNDPLAHQELAGAYAAAGAAEDALTELVGGLIADPKNAALHAAVGQLHLETGQPAAALPALTRALELNPAQYEVRYALATALTRLGRADEASRQLALFEAARRDQLDHRRQQIQNEVDREETLRHPEGSAAR